MVRGEKTERPLFMPFVFTYASKLMQISVKQQLHDPTSLAISLEKAHRLFMDDAIVTNFDTTLEAEALGLPVLWNSGLPTLGNSKKPQELSDFEPQGVSNRGRIPVVIEATKRIITVKGKEVPVLAGVTGPARLAESLLGSPLISAPSRIRARSLDLAMEVLLELERIFCDIGVDGLLIVDDRLPALPANELKEIIQPAWNVLHHYEIPSIVVTMTRSINESLKMLELGATAISLGSIVPADKIASAITNKKTETITYAACISHQDLATSPNLLVDNITDILKLKGSFFISTEWELPLDISPEKITAVSKAIRKQSAEKT